MWRAVLFLIAGPAMADSVVATRNIPANAVISAEDITRVAMEIPGAVQHETDAIGQQVALAIRAGDVLQADLLMPQVHIARNARVELILTLGGLEIRTEGRALAAGYAGDTIEVMNLASRAKISGVIDRNGAVRIHSPQKQD